VLSRARALQARRRRRGDAATRARRRRRLVSSPLLAGDPRRGALAWQR
jgi:hypothetical protein